MSRLPCISDYRAGDETDPRSPYYDDRAELANEDRVETIYADLAKIIDNPNGYDYPCQVDYNLGAADLLLALLESEYEPLIRDLLQREVRKLAEWKANDERNL